MKYNAGRITNSLLAAFGLAAAVGFADYLGADEAIVDALPDKVEERVESTIGTEGLVTGSAVLVGGLAMLGMNLPKNNKP